jgi:hypothetical protein
MERSINPTLRNDFLPVLRCNPKQKYAVRLLDEQQKADGIDYADFP